jgi:hypothetical protein
MPDPPGNRAQVLSAPCPLPASFSRPNQIYSADRLRYQHSCSRDESLARGASSTSSRACYPLVCALSLAHAARPCGPDHIRGAAPPHEELRRRRCRAPSARGLVALPLNSVKILWKTLACQTSHWTGPTVLRAATIHLKPVPNIVVLASTRWD